MASATVHFRSNVGVNVCFVLFSLLCFHRLSTCAQKTPYKSVNLGGWLVVEGWIKPELFKYVPEMMDGAKIQLKSVKFGTYVVAEDGGGKKIAVNRKSNSSWETFKLWREKEGAYYLRTLNKQFVGAHKGGGGIVNAVAMKASRWETFDIIRNPSDKNLVHIKAWNGMYIQASSPDQLTADFQGEPRWDDDAATFEMNKVEMQGEYQLTKGLRQSLGPLEAQLVLNKHWSSFITEEDFAFLSQHGINAVRIPVGWWIKDLNNPPRPFVGGSHNALDKAFIWAKKNRIKIIVDLHAVPGSQNGQDHSATRDGTIEWPDYEKNIHESLQVIDFLAQRYGKHPALLGIELLNEPHAPTRSPTIHLDKLKKYYNDGYHIVRKYNPDAYVVMCNRLGNGVDPKELFDLNQEGMVVDVHWYNAYEPKFDGMPAQQNIHYISSERADELTKLMTVDGPQIYVGEWSTAWKAPNPSMSDYQEFGQKQQEVYGKASFGWAFWTFKTSQGDGVNPWSLKWMVENNYLQIQ